MNFFKKRVQNGCFEHQKYTKYQITEHINVKFMYPFD